MKLKAGMWIVLITVNDVKATGFVTHDPCFQTMVKYVDENGDTGNAYKIHIKNWAEIQVNWEAGRFEKNI